MSLKKKSSKKKTGKSAALPFDKYALYHESVQSPEGDVLFLRGAYRELKNKEPRSLREDFCGTFALCCEWAKLDANKEAFGVDLDPEPLNYGKTHYFSELTAQQQSRVHPTEGNVLTGELPKTDIGIAMNFSYFIFKTREQMKIYFSNALKSVNENGIFVIDLFGGSLCYDANEERIGHGKFAYYWDQKNFDPVTNNAQFYIHFKLRGQKKIEKVFSYDWRMWSIPELREIMQEVGFKKTHIYWEGTNSKGGGNGKFKRTEVGESCLSWVAYIVAER